MDSTRQKWRCITFQTENSFQHTCGCKQPTFLGLPRWYFLTKLPQAKMPRVNQFAPPTSPKRSPPKEFLLLEFLRKKRPDSTPHSWCRHTCCSNPIAPQIVWKLPQCPKQSTSFLSLKSCHLSFPSPSALGQQSPDNLQVTNTTTGQVKRSGNILEVSDSSAVKS